jgi:hypothetical protein
MNIIPKDPYADALLLNIKVMKPGVVIKRDAYADGLLHYVQDGAAPAFPVDEKAPHHDEAGDV